MKIIYPNGITIECTRDEYLECIKDEQVQSQKEVINAINDFKQALFAKFDTNRDILKEIMLTLRKLSELYEKNIQKPIVEQVAEILAKQTAITHDGEIKPLFPASVTAVVEGTENDSVTVGVSDGNSSTTQMSDEFLTPTSQDNTDNPDNSDDMKEHIVYAFMCDEYENIDFDNPTHTYKTPKEAADDFKLSIQFFMTLLDKKDSWKGYYFVSKHKISPKKKSESIKTRNRKGKSVYVYDKEWGNEKKFLSVTQASRMTAISVVTILKNIDQNKLVKNKYYFTSEPIESKVETVVTDNTAEEDIPEIEKTMREIDARNKEPYQTSPRIS